MQIKITMLGFGRVGRALARLLVSKAEVLRQEYDLTVTVTGITTHSHGLAIDPAGLDLAAALRLVEAGRKLDTLHQGAPVHDMQAFITSCPADLVMETTWLNPRTGQPATDYARAALNAGRHVVTANKGPVAFAYRELTALAKEKDRGFFFESTVMDGAPVLGIGREALLATTVQRIRGILNSTTNSILTSLEEGLTFDEAVARAQHEVRAAVEAGERIKLLCEAYRVGGDVRASVHPVRLSLSDPLSQVRETSSAVMFQTDTLHELTIFEGNSDPTTTAYGMLVDMINILRGRYR
jgi:homoserine dehydrogenase